jgi:hypothetical protein
MLRVDADFGCIFTCMMQQMADIVQQRRNYQPILAARKRDIASRAAASPKR